MKTSYFSFGQKHVHVIKGKVFDKDCLVSITANDPREVMDKTFGNEWCWEYYTPPDRSYYPRGIIPLDYL